MPVIEHLEVERKFDVDTCAQAPDWHGLRVGEPAGSILRAVYFDTADQRLLSRKITLRWRTGELEEGWHLKFPGNAGRTELQVRAHDVDPDRPIGPAELPEAFAVRLRAWVRERPLVPVARLVTLRDETRVHGAGTFCDDTVTATRVADNTSRTWREWEFELIDQPDPVLVGDAEEQIRRSGARPASSASKLAKALGHVEKPAKASRKPPTIHSFLAQRLQPARDRLCTQDFPVRMDEFDSVHQLRVTTRTIRSLLQAFGPFLRKAPTRRLSAELRWLAAELGEARDAEVRAARFATLASANTKKRPELSATAESLAIDERKAYQLAHRDVLRALDSRRYFRLLDALDMFVADPPVRKISVKTPASVALSEAVDGAADRLFAADTALAAAADHAEHEESLHEVRKRAKALRYVGELAVAAGTGPYGWLLPVKQLQELLGEHQDAVVLRNWLRERSTREASETLRHGLDQLIATERARAKKTEAEYPSAIAAVLQAWNDRQQ